MCDYRNPDILPGNYEVVKLMNLSRNCINYVAGMDGLIATGYNWQSIEVMARGSRIKLRPPLLNKLVTLESLAIKYLNQKKGGEASG